MVTCPLGKAVTKPFSAGLVPVIVMLLWIVIEVDHGLGALGAGGREGGGRGDLVGAVRQCVAVDGDRAVGGLDRVRRSGRGCRVGDVVETEEVARAAGLGDVEDRGGGGRAVVLGEAVLLTPVSLAGSSLGVPGVPSWPETVKVPPPLAAAKSALAA